MKQTIQKTPLILAFICLLSVSKVAAQDALTDNHQVSVTIPKVAILDIELSTSKNISFLLVAPTEAGNPITMPLANTDLWLNYSSITAASGSGSTRTISVKASALIPGIDLKVTAATDMGAGAGTKGAPVAGGVTLTAADQVLISGIGSCWTDTGVGKGHLLTYAVALQSSATYGSIASGTPAITVTYTLSD